MQQQTGNLPPHVVMMQMLNGQLISRCLGLVAELGIADCLIDGPNDTDFLAEATGTQPDALYRILRTLAGVGVFVEGDNGRSLFAQTYPAWF